MELRVEVELEVDAFRAVRDLEDRPRLEVLEGVGAVSVAVVTVAARTALGRVLDVCHDVRATVEAGQVQKRTLVDASAVRNAHFAQLLLGPCDPKARPHLLRWVRDAAK